MGGAGLATCWLRLRLCVQCGHNRKAGVEDRHSQHERPVFPVTSENQGHTQEEHGNVCGHANKAPSAHRRVLPVVTRGGVGLAAGCVETVTVGFFVTVVLRLFVT